MRRSPAGASGSAVAPGSERSSEYRSVRPCQIAPSAADSSASVAPRRSRPPRSWPRAREQAEEQLALGRQPGPVAVVAEGPGHARDAADFAGHARLCIAPAFRGLADGAHRQRLDREGLADAPQHLGRRHDLVHAPAVGGADIHELDEPQRHVAAAEVPHHGQDLRVVDTALDDHVDLDRAEPGPLRGIDAVENARDRELGVVHVPEDAVVDRVEAHRDSAEARIAQRLRLARQQRAVGGQGQVERLVFHGAQGREQGDQPFQVAPQQRLAAGQPDLAHAMADEDPRHAGDLLEAQQRRLRQEGIALVEDFLRHAVAAAEVAAVGDGDAQVVHRPLHAVEEDAAGRLQRRRDHRHRVEATQVRQGDDALGHLPIVPVALRRTRRVASAIREAWARKERPGQPQSAWAPPHRARRAPARHGARR